MAKPLLTMRSATSAGAPSVRTCTSASSTAEARGWRGVNVNAEARGWKGAS